MHTYQLNCNVCPSYLYIIYKNFNILIVDIHENQMYGVHILIKYKYLDILLKFYYRK